MIIKDKTSGVVIDMPDEREAQRLISAGIYEKANKREHTKQRLAHDKAFEIMVDQASRQPAQSVQSVLTRNDTNTPVYGANGKVIGFNRILQTNTTPTVQNATL